MERKEMYIRVLALADGLLLGIGLAGGVGLGRCVLHDAEAGSCCLSHLILSLFHAPPSVVAPLW